MFMLNGGVGSTVKAFAMCWVGGFGEGGVPLVPLQPIQIPAAREKECSPTPCSCVVGWLLRVGLSAPG